MAKTNGIRSLVILFQVKRKNPLPSVLKNVEPIPEI
jgi:hypothetical protein